MDLEVIHSEGPSTVWDTPFETAVDGYLKMERVVTEEGWGPLMGYHRQRLAKRFPSDAPDNLNKVKLQFSVSSSGFLETEPDRPAKSISCSCGGRPPQRRHLGLHGGTTYKRLLGRPRAQLECPGHRPE